MGNNKLLSIIIPTYNRAEITAYTLSLFQQQIVRRADEVELIVCDNASNDNTQSLLTHLGNNSFYKYVRYDDHVDVGHSIVRATENATGRFFLIYGDDDIPAPYMVDVLIDTIKKYNDISYVGFNRLRGNSFFDSFEIQDLVVAGQNIIDGYVKEYNDISDYAEEHQNEVGFLSVNIVRNDLWRDRYQDVFPNDHRGYEFIIPFLYSAKGFKCVYIQYPLCVQRVPASKGGRGQHQWTNGLSYFYLGRPRAIYAQEKYGIVHDAHELFSNYEVQFGREYLLSQLISLPQDSSEIYESISEISSYLSDELEKEMVMNILSSRGYIRKMYQMYYKIKLYGIKYVIRRVMRLLKIRK